MKKDEFINEYNKDKNRGIEPFVRCLNGRIVEIKNVSEYADFPLTESGCFGFVTPYTEDINFSFIPYGNYNDKELYEKSDKSLSKFAKLLLENGYIVFKLYAYEHSWFYISGYERVDENTKEFDDTDIYALYYNKENITNINDYIERTNDWFLGSVYSIEIKDTNNEYYDSDWYYGLRELGKAIESFDWECSEEDDIKVELEAFSLNIIEKVSQKAKEKLKSLI